MFFLNGIKNIKIILIVSISFFLFVSLIIHLKFKETKNAQISFVCSTHYQFGKTSNDTMDYPEIYLKYCKRFQDQIDKKYSNLNGISQNLKFTYLEPDNFSYLNNFTKLNEINFAKKKILNSLEKNNINTRSLLNSISYSISKPNFMEVKNKKFIDEIQTLKTLEFLRKHHIHNIEVVTIFSILYTFIFQTNENILLFLNLLNFLILVLISIFIFYFFKEFINNKDGIIYYLVLFSILNPINIYYFLSFFKEPFILLFFTGLIVNFIFLKNNYKYKYFSLILSLIFILTLFLILLEIKDVYFLPSIAGLIFAYFFFIYEKKSYLYSLLIILKISFIVIFLTEVNSFYKLTPHNISNERLGELIKTKISILIKDEDHIQNEKNQAKSHFRTNTDTINKINIGNEKFIKESFKTKKFQYLKCKNEILNKVCNKVNSLTYQISKLKLATTNEIKDANKESVIKGYYFNGVNDVLKNVPIAFFKSHIMPINFKLNINIIILSVYKFILILFSIIFIYKLNNSRNINILIKAVIIFLPLLTVIDLISSNFFTYFRYVLPYNFILTLIAVLGFLIIFKNNDKYFYKFRS